MLKIREAIVVEGRYDKNTLSQVVDTVILETAGFGIFRDEETLALLRRIGAKRGLILLTDSDGAGFLIRNYLKGALPQDQVKHAYIPDILGKERRKASPSKEGKLGVEGMELSVLRQALERAGATVEDGPVPQKETAQPLTKADLFQLGLTGGEDSAARRKALQKRLGLPERLSANGLLQALNTLYSREELRAALEKEE